MHAAGRSTLATASGSRLFYRSLALFLNFFCIILAYYQVKAASRSLLLEFGGAAWFPYAWVCSALALMVLLSFYHRIVARGSRIGIVLGSLLVFAVLLLLFRTVATPRNTMTALGFYIFVDIFSVILVEQFWSLTDSISDTSQGQRSFWFVGTGGLLGGALGGLLASALVGELGLATVDLLYVCAALLMVLFTINVAMWRAGTYVEISDRLPDLPADSNWRELIGNRYLQLIAVLLCCSQLAQPVVEYQFLDAIVTRYTDLDARTAFISKFFSILGVVSIAINVLITPFMHRVFGAIGGLFVQPVTLALCSFGFFAHPTLWVAGAMKISDRGLSYSINRASKELLYIPIDPVHTYQAKAWIDMFGYRLFKTGGAGLIVLANALRPGQSTAELVWLTVLICGLWILCILRVARLYRGALPHII